MYDHPELCGSLYDSHLDGSGVCYTSRLRPVLNFAPLQLQVPPDVTLRNVNMAMELEGLSFALTNRDR